MEYRTGDGCTSDTNGREKWLSEYVETVRKQNVREEKLLEVLLSSERSTKEKREILQEEFDIKMTQELEREVSEMCNLSDGVEQKGIAKGRAYGIVEGIATSIRKLMESMGWSIEQAMDALQIPTEERNDYLNMLKK